MRDHGGNLDLAIERHGGSATAWLDLSTGINRSPYPMSRASPHAWRDLPTAAEMAMLCKAATAAYGATGGVVALCGAQAAIQSIPLLRKPGLARIVGPTYNEHEASLLASGWEVEMVGELEALDGADLAIVVNPNNPDGRHWNPDRLLARLERVGVLVIDESFADATPEISLAGFTGAKGLIVLRSFGKFYGLAGLRLGFALASESDAAALRRLAGPWPVCGPAIEAGIAALGDGEWTRATRVRLLRDRERLDEFARAEGWKLVGGTALFRTYATHGALPAQTRLAESRVWTRIFPWSASWIRLGLPGNEDEWKWLAGAFRHR